MCAITGGACSRASRGLLPAQGVGVGVGHLLGRKSAQRCDARARGSPRPAGHYSFLLVITSSDFLPRRRLCASGLAPWPAAEADPHGQEIRSTSRNKASETSKGTHGLNRCQERLPGMCDVGDVHPPIRGSPHLPSSLAEVRGKPLPVRQIPYPAAQGGPPCLQRNPQ